MEKKSKSTANKKWRIFVLSGAISILLILGGYLFYSFEEKSIWEEKRQAIQSIAILKISQLTQWRKERLGDAAIVTQSRFFSKEIQLWLGNKNNSSLEKDILEQFSQFKTHYGYEDIFLASPQGEFLLALNPKEKTFETLASLSIQEAIKKQKITFTDFYYCATHNKIHYDIIATVVDDKNIAIAAVLFRIDPEDYLYPLIQTWPTPSKTAETLLLRKDGNSVLFLNELRHQKNTALKLRIPLTKKEIPAVQAVLGYKGIWEGKDYRGVPVLSDIQPIAGTPWFMISKIDKSEINTDLYFHEIYIIILVLILIFFINAGLAWFYFFHKANIYKKLFAKEQELREAGEKFSTLFASMTEMVVLHELVFNDKGEAVNYRIIDCNNAFTEITGIKKENAVGKLATEVYQTESPPYFDEYIGVAMTGKMCEYVTYFAPMDKHFSISVVSPSKNQFATITTDITAIQQIQKVLSDKNKELENYLYVSSHDLRTPLVNIQGFSHRLQKNVASIKALLNECSLESEIKAKIDSIIDESIPRTLNFINTNVSKMDILVSALLQISRTGKVKMTIKKVDMNQLFEKIISSLNFQLTELSAKVIVQEMPACYGDENLLNQLFTNIIVNAIKYRDSENPLVLKISAKAERNKVIYNLKDNGIGIAPGHLEKIWNVFYRVDSASLETGEGIGLNVASIITEKHKGKIWAESEKGKGSVFSIELQTNKFTEE